MPGNNTDSPGRIILNELRARRSEQAWQMLPDETVMSEDPITQPNIEIAEAQQQPDFDNLREAAELIERIYGEATLGQPQECTLGQSTIEVATPSVTLGEGFYNTSVGDVVVDTGVEEDCTIDELSQAQPESPDYSYTIQSLRDTTRRRRGVPRNNELLQSSQKRQRRLLAAVTRDGELMFVEYEDRDTFYNTRECLGIRTNVWLIRKCPPHIAKKLVEFRGTPDVEENRYKAWEYIQDSGFMLRNL